MHKNPPEAELYPAWSWDCDACGQNNFARSVNYNRDELTAEQQAEWDEVAAELGTCRLLTQPDTVTCGRCGATYSVKLNPPDECE